MDSGNSGSMQSSSGEEEYDSRSESAAAAPPPPQVFLNPHHYHYQNQQPPPPPAFFDNIHPLFQSHESQHNSNPNSFLNLDFLASTTNNNNNNTVNIQGSSSSSLAAAAAAGDHHHHHHHQGRLVNDKTNVVIKNPKKRTRTSRRAPTTVLTTDTSNFRAMVQEFTGIPSQPFSVGSSPYSRRLDLFKSSGNYNLESMGPLHHPTRPAAINFAAATASQDMLNNFMQQNLNHPLSNPSLHNVTGATFVGANKSHASNFGVPPFENHHHLAMSHAHVGILPNQDHLRSFDGHFGNSSQRVTSCKLNYSAASSDFHHDKNLENVSSRGTEGTVDSWICPSD